MKFRHTILYFSTLFLLGACQKDIDIFIPSATTGADTNWVASISASSLSGQIKAALVKNVLLDSVDATVGGTITTPEGLTLVITPQSFMKASGSTVTGKVYIETILIRSKGDMVRMDKPTTSNGRMLISGGEIFIKVMKETEELQLIAGKRIHIKYADPQASSQMKLFVGDESNPEQFNWIPSPDSSALSLSSQPVLGYQLMSSSLRWINCDFFADSSGQRTNITTSLPVDYTNGNTIVYLVFKNLKSVMGMYGNQTTKKFSSQKVPVGRPATIVSITKKANNSYYFSAESIITGATNVGGGTTGNHVVPLNPQPKSLNDIKAFLATL